MTECVFCGLIADGAVDYEWPEAVVITPRNPVTVGHIMVIPRQHVADATEDPWVTATTMYRAAELALRTSPALNLITSVGPAATQTVMHLHIHVVPRRPGDGLHLPWTGQVKTRA